MEAGVGDTCDSKDTGVSVLETIGTVTCVSGYLDCLELDVGDKRVECLWARIIRKDKMTVRVYYRPSNQDEEAEEVFYKQLGEVSPSLVLVLVGGFNLTGICWEYNAAEESTGGS